jgi:hypothetical protein
MSKADSKGYYACLGVEPWASADQIRAAYHRSAKQCHPDVNPSPQAKARFQAINEAYRILGHPHRRATYDNTRRTGALAAIDLGPVRWRRTEFDVNLLAPRLKGLAQFVGLGALGLTVLWLIVEATVGSHGFELVLGPSSPALSESATPAVLEAGALAFEQTPEPAKLAPAIAAGAVLSGPASSVTSFSPLPASTENKALAGAWLLRDPPNPKPALNLFHGEEAASLQEQLIERGYLIGPADGVWGPRSHAALEDFWRTQGNRGAQIQTGLDGTRKETPVVVEPHGSGEEAASLSEPTLLLSQGDEASTVSAADQGGNTASELRLAARSGQAGAEHTAQVAYVGAWARSRADCFSEAGAPPLAISAQRAESFGGVEGTCEFAQVQRDGAGWRTRARCSARGRSWTSNVQLTVTGSTLSWSSERGRATYHRCPGQ